MLNQNIRPSTIGGIKRHAKQLKKDQNIPYHAALNMAARNASFESFAHARNQLSVNNDQQLNQLFFAIYWYDRKRGIAGREVLEITLSKPLFEIITKNEIKKKHTSLGKFRLASADLLVCDNLSQSQEEAINNICYAVRVLRFMEATGLKPSSDLKASYPQRDHNNKLPKLDHETYWLDPVVDQFILIDEPYLDPVVNGEREAWAKFHNWHLQPSKWAGMYYPNLSSMFVATDASTGYDFKGLMNKIDNLPAPLTIESWSGSSSMGHDTFLSPQSITAQDKKRAVAKGTIFRFSSNKTVPMKSWDAPYNERRPNAVMSIDSHLLAARLIKTIEQSSAKPADVNSRLWSIKSKLEDWFFSEHDSETTNKFDQIYYGRAEIAEPMALRADSPKAIVEMLLELKNILSSAYVDCAPLRKIIAKIDTSIRLTDANI